MKLAVVGGGAIGGLVGGLLAADNKDVTVVGRQDFADTVRSSGLSIKRIDGEILNIRPRVTTSIRDIKSADALMLCVKSQDTVEVCESIKDYISPDMIIFSLQNGVRNRDLIRSVLKNNRIVRTVVMFNSVYIKPGEISQGSDGSLIVEDLTWARETVNFINDSLKKAGLGCIYEDNIEGVMWSKLLFNLMNAVAAATNLGAKDIMADPDTSRIARETLKEGKRVVIGSGRTLKNMGGTSINALLFLLSTPLFFKRLMLSRMNKTDVVMPSTLQSILRGRKTEIDYLNGEIVRLAGETGLDAPVNKALVEAVKAVEVSMEEGSAKFYSPAELKELISLKMKKD
jgi:2-dehydropantoate 2-reductase